MPLRSWQTHSLPAKAWAGMRLSLGRGDLPPDGDLHRPLLHDGRGITLADDDCRNELLVSLQRLLDGLEGPLGEPHLDRLGLAWLEGKRDLLALEAKRADDLSLALALGLDLLDRGQEADLAALAGAHLEDERLALQEL